MENYAVLKCPFCGEAQIVDIPKEKCLTFLVCKFCNKLVTTPANNCCVICAFSDKKCPASISKKQFKKDILAMLIIGGVVATGFYFWQNSFYKNIFGNQETKRREQTKQLAANILPKDGDYFINDIYFNEEGYKKLLVIGQTVGVNKDLYENKLAGLDVWIPCCDFKYIATDPSQNCQCGHHVALYGAAKVLAQKNLSKTDIQKGIDKWRAYFFPQEFEKFQSNNSRGNC